MVIVSTHPLNNGVIRLDAAGEIDMATVDVLVKELHEAVTAAGVSRVEVDFGGVTFCDSSGIAALDEAYGGAQRRGVTLRLVNLQPPVSRVLELTGLLDVFTGR